MTMSFGYPSSDHYALVSIDTNRANSLRTLEIADVARPLEKEMDLSNELSPFSHSVPAFRKNGRATDRGYFFLIFLVIFFCWNHTTTSIYFFLPIYPF